MTNRTGIMAQVGQLTRNHADHIADGLGAASTVGLGATLLSDIDVIVSIIAGILVAISAALSIYFHIKKWKQERSEDRSK